MLWVDDMCKDCVIFVGNRSLFFSLVVSYGSLAKNRKTSRLLKVSDNCGLGFSGEYSDFQEIKIVLDRLMTQEFCQDDKITMQPR